MRKYLYSGVSLALLGVPVAAQETDTITLESVRVVPEETITVTATGTRIEVEDSGQAVTVLGQDEIASVQGADLTRVLERVPGLTVTRTGGAGSFTGVRLRGAEAEQTLVVLDGVRVADPAAPGGGFDFGNLLSANLAKIENGNSVEAAQASLDQAQEILSATQAQVDATNEANDVATERARVQLDFDRDQLDRAQDRLAADEAGCGHPSPTTPPATAAPRPSTVQLWLATWRV